MRRFWLVLVLMAVGCASAPLKKSDQASLAVAETRWLEGCYECLVEARDTFQRLAVGKARPLLIRRLFESHILVGLRQKELAIDPAESFKSAEALVPELPAPFPGARYLDIARLIPADSIGVPRTTSDAWLRRQPGLPAIDKLIAELKDAPPPPAKTNAPLAPVQGSAPFRAYLAASLHCAAVQARRLYNDLPKIADDASSLERYRGGTCPAVQPKELERVVAAVPAFVEAELMVARVPSLFRTSAYVKRQREAFAAAYKVFPRSPSVTYGHGALYQTVGDCKAAIRHYEETIAIEPLHEEAAMQRVICLGHIGQFVPSIEGATRIIERRYYNFADAYYWRAWNHYRRQDLPSARTDIDEARRVAVNLPVLVLGGMIKYDQRELDLAERDLAEAIKMDIYSEQCIAHWYYGLVGFAREHWPDTANRFARASTCYRRAADRSRGDLEKMKKADVDEDFRKSQIAGFEAAIKEDTDQEQAAYLNTANCYARAGDTAKAREWLDKIPAESIHALVAAELRKQIGG